MAQTRFSSVLASAALIAFAALTPAVQAAPVKNIVVVHGSLADGSGWRKVFDLLGDKGYKVTIVQPPMTSLEDDINATHRILALQDGPSVLVGHSYGGMVITEADNVDSVAGLVYIAAFQPDAGDTLVSLAGSLPPATTGITATTDGFPYLDPAVYAANFAADVPAADAAFMAASQVFPAKIAFEPPIVQPAWRGKKRWAFIATDDRAIHPELMRRMAERAGSTTVVVKASHAVFMSQPEAVARLIEAAAEALSQ